MNGKIELIYLILILTLNFSCVENKKSEKKPNNNEVVATSKTDTLRFTSGIRAIYQDSRGDYWIGSHNEGLCCYNGKSYEYFTVNEGLQDNQIRSIQEDKNGIIWIATARGVCSYNEEKISNYTTEFNSPKLDWNATTGNLWFYAGEEDGIFRFDGINMNYLIFPKHKNDNQNKSYGITGISKSSDGEIWIATYSALFSYDGKMTNVFDHVNLELQDKEILHIRSVLADSKGRIWVGNNGIGVILIKGDSITHFSKEKGKLIPMNEFKANIKMQKFDKNVGLQSVFSIEEDSEGNIWFGDRDSGAWKYDGKTLSNYKVDMKLKSQMIWSIYEDQNKNLLFGMAEGGIYKFNGKSFIKWF